MTFADFLGVLAILIPTIGFLYERKNSEARQISKDFGAGKKSAYISRLKSPPFLQLYNHKLSTVLDYLDNNFGKPFSYRSNNLTTNLAVFYSFAVFFFIWLFSGAGKLGMVLILDESIDQYTRTLMSVGYLSFLILTYVLLGPRKTHPALFKNNLVYRGSQVFVLLPYVVVAILVASEWILQYRPSEFILTFVTIMFASTLSGAILFVTFSNRSGAVVFAVTFTTLVAGAAVASTSLQFSRSPVLCIVSILVLIFMFASIYFVQKKWGAPRVYGINIVFVCSYVLVVYFYPNILGMDKLSATLIYFFVLLPSLNGLMDWTSLSISRVLSARIVKTPEMNVLVSHVLLALLAALFLLSALIIVFIVATKLFNMFVVGSRSYAIPVSELIDATKAHPLSKEGLWVTVMLGSTLVPTAFHFSISFAAIFIKYSLKDYRNYLIRLIGPKRADPSSISKLAWYFVLVNFFSGLLTISASLVVVYIVAPFVSQYAYALAIWSTQLF
jgi:hypothetical protein